MRYLHANDLEGLEVGAIVFDNMATRYFKLVEGTWASENFLIIESSELAKKKVRRDHSSTQQF